MSSARRCATTSCTGGSFSTRRRIEGLSRHASVHAAGIVIAPGPLADYVPVCTAPTKGSGAGIDGEDTIICQYDMGALEKVGMLKMDFLGLRTLTVIHDAVEMIRAKTGTAPDLDPLDARRPRGVRDAPRGPHVRGLPVRIGARHRHAAQHEVRPVRRPRRVQRAAAPGSARRRHAPRLHQAQARPGTGDVPRIRCWPRCSSRPTASSPTRNR